MLLNFNAARVFLFVRVCAGVRAACVHARARTRGGGVGWGACSGLRTEGRQCRRGPGKYPALRRHHAKRGSRPPWSSPYPVPRPRREACARAGEGKKGEEFGYEVREKEKERIPCLERNKELSNNSCTVAKYSHDAKVAQDL